MHILPPVYTLEQLGSSSASSTCTKNTHLRFLAEFLALRRDLIQRRVPFLCSFSYLAVFTSRVQRYKLQEFKREVTKAPQLLKLRV